MHDLQIRNFLFFSFSSLNILAEGMCGLFLCRTIKYLAVKLHLWILSQYHVSYLCQCSDSPIIMNLKYALLNACLLLTSLWCFCNFFSHSFKENKSCHIKEMFHATPFDYLVFSFWPMNMFHQSTHWLSESDWKAGCRNGVASQDSPKGGCLASQCNAARSVKHCFQLDV